MVTHVIDRRGRWAANFHGLRFDSLNLVLYINGLVNNGDRPADKKPLDWWNKLKSLVE